MQSHFFNMLEMILAKDIDAFEKYMHPEFISVSEFEMSTREDFWPRCRSGLMMRLLT